MAQPLPREISRVSKETTRVLLPNPGANQSATFNPSGRAFKLLSVCYVFQNSELTPQDSGVLFRSGALNICGAQAPIVAASTTILATGFIAGPTCIAAGTSLQQSFCLPDVKFEGDTTILIASSAPAFNITNAVLMIFFY